MERNRHWLAVASAEHVRIGQAHGFTQVNHGKLAPLRRLRAGDGIVTYSPTETFGGKDRLQAFTAIGIVEEGEPWQVDLGEGFAPFRRRVRWAEATPAPIGPLRDRLTLTTDNPNWGFLLRRGLLPLAAADFQRIADAISADALSAA